MRKHFLYVIACGILLVAIVNCTKSSEDSLDDNAKVSKESFADHLVPPSEAKDMIERYDQLIGLVIQNKFKEQNKNYISPYVVIHEIEPMIKYLTYLKQKANTHVFIRFAAISGDEENSRIPGLPYHTLLFYGKKLNKGLLDMKLTEQDVDFYDHGNLAPPPDETDSIGTIGNLP